MTKIFKRHLQTEWWGYLLIAGLACALWLLAFQVKFTPPRNRTFSVVFAGEGLQTESLRSALEDRLPSVTAQPIEKVNVAAVDLQSGYQDQTLYSLADQADLIIVQEDVISEDKIGFYFDSLKDPEGIVSYTAGAEYYKIGGKIVGVKLYDGSTQNNFSRYYGGEKACWVFFGYKSECLNGVNGTGKAGDDAGLQALAWLLEV